ncbi:MAG: rRNA synthase [Solirubrobacteraceae bacterium]|nr:rRNA synthase [Solirubrobacteraceae bacterium]
MRVPPDADGQRLDVYLAAHAGSRAAAQKLIDAGLVTVDGTARPKRHVVRAGEEVSVGEDVREAAASDVPPAEFAVAYEDDDVLVIDKPAGVVVHPGSGYRHGTLVQALGDRVAGGDDPVRPGVVHRLDRDTTGLLVLARNAAAHAALGDQIRARSVTREYLALVEGRPPARAGTIDAPLGRDRRRRTRMSSDTDDPREAVTHFELVEALREASLLRLRLETGRTHQIRAHLLAIGHPVLGDPEYGGVGGGGLRLERQFLHAARLAFDHPVSGKRLDLESPLPPDLEAALLTSRAQ